MKIPVIATLTFCMTSTVMLSASANNDLKGNWSDNTFLKVNQNETNDDGATTESATFNSMEQVMPTSKPPEMPILLIEVDMITKSPHIASRSSQPLPSESPKNESADHHSETRRTEGFQLLTVTNSTPDLHRNLSLNEFHITTVPSATEASSNPPAVPKSSSKPPALQSVSTNTGDRILGFELSKNPDLSRAMMNVSKELKVEGMPSARNSNDSSNHMSETSTVLSSVAVTKTNGDGDIDLLNTTTVPRLLPPPTTQVDGLQLQDLNTSEVPFLVPSVTENVGNFFANSTPSIDSNSSQPPHVMEKTDTTEKDLLPLVPSKDPIGTINETSRTNTFVSDFWSTVGPLVILCIAIAMIMGYLYYKICSKKSVEPPQVIVVRDAADWTFRISGSNRHGSSRRN